MKFRSQMENHVSYYMSPKSL